MKEPYDWDAYAAVFAPHAEKLVARAEEAEKAGETEKASVLYLWVLLPPRCPWGAWAASRGAKEKIC